MNLGLHLRLSWTIPLLPLLLLLPFLYFSIGLLPIDLCGTNRQLTNFHLHRGQSEMELKYLNKFLIIAYDWILSGAVVKCLPIVLVFPSSCLSACQTAGLPANLSAWPVCHAYLLDCCACLHACLSANLFLSVFLSASLPACLSVWSNRTNGNRQTFYCLLLSVIRNQNYVAVRKRQSKACYNGRINKRDHQWHQVVWNFDLNWRETFSTKLS